MEANGVSRAKQSTAGPFPLWSGRLGAAACDLSIVRAVPAHGLTQLVLALACHAACALCGSVPVVPGASRASLTFALLFVWLPHLTENTVA